MSWNIRPATNQDCNAIQQLVFTVLSEYGLNPDPDGTDSDLNDVEENYQAAGGRFDVLVDQNGIVVGCVGLFLISRSVCELRKMYVSHSIRGQGQGRRLLEHALAQAVKYGFARVELETASVLKEAGNLYERYGFRQCKPRHLAIRCDSAYFLDLFPSEQSGDDNSSNKF